MSAPTLPSSIDAVTVFRRGAIVTRTATLPRGDQGFPAMVRLEGLPLLLDDDSLQVELQPVGEGIAPLAGDLRVTLAVPAPDDDLRPPTDEELEAAKLEHARAQQAQADLEAVRTRVAGLTPGPRGTPEEGAAPMASPTEARLGLLALRRERLERLRPQVLAAAERIRAAQERLQTLQERERRASAAKNPRQFEARKAVVIRLLPAAGDPVERLELRLRYFVPGARWAPSYVLRLNPSLDAGTLELRALVGQATGERWNDVALTLSTAHPQQWTELPELRSLRIGRRQPPPAKTGWRPPPPGTELLYADFDRIGRPEPPTETAPPPPPPKSGRGPGSPPAYSQNLTQTGTISFDLEEVAAIAQEATANFALPEPQAKVRKAQAKKRDAQVRPSRPMPPPSAPPAPMASGGPPPGGVPMMEEAKSFRAEGRGRVVGDMSSMRFGAAGGGALADEDDDGYGGSMDAPAPVLAGRDLLEYGGLVLPAADDEGRGALRRMDRAQRYGRLADLPADQVANALQRAQRARTQAQALEDRGPPGDHHWVEPTDGFDYAYRAEARVGVDSDGELHGLPLSAPEVQSTPRYICVPRESSDVFRVMVLRNPIDAPLLPGPVDVYLGGRFALASALDLTPPGGRVELGLGVEQGIKVARNVGFDDESSGLLKRHRELQHRVRVEVRNNLSKDARIEIRERVSVIHENEDDIEVTVGDVEPPWDEFEQDPEPLRGGRRWMVDVAAGSERTLRASWSIRISQNHELVGGNRREG